jgi:hypothetical protein
MPITPRTKFMDHDESPKQPYRVQMPAHPDVLAQQKKAKQGTPAPLPPAGDTAPVRIPVAMPAPTPAPVPKAKLPVKDYQSVYKPLGTLDPISAAIEQTMLSAFDTSEAAAKFLYAGAARRAEDEDDDTPRWGRRDEPSWQAYRQSERDFQEEDEDIFETIYALGIEQFDSERAEHQRLMAQLTGEEEITPQFITFTRQNLMYSTRRLAELNQGLNLHAVDNFAQMNSRDRAELLGAVLGYRIEFNEGSNEVARLEQLQNLAVASLQVIDYINSVVPPELGLNSVDIFTRFYTRSRAITSSTRTPITVYLGADEIAGTYSGLTPMPVNNRDAPEELGKLYLGSEVSAGTIMHELTHQIDRYFDGRLSENLTAYIPANSDERLNISYSEELMLTRAARANETSASELAADLGMTAYGDIAPGQFYVESDNPADIVGFNYEYRNRASNEISTMLDAYFAYIFSTGQLPE